MAAIVYGANLWTYYGPLKGSEARLAFRSRMESVAGRRRPPVDTLPGVGGNDVEAVLDALTVSHSGGGH